jgi:hypothetical protein
VPSSRDLSRAYRKTVGCERSGGIRALSHSF